MPPEEAILVRCFIPGESSAIEHQLAPDETVGDLRAAFEAPANSVAYCVKTDGETAFVLDHDAQRPSWYLDAGGAVYLLPAVG